MRKLLAALFLSSLLPLAACGVHRPAEVPLAPQPPPWNGEVRGQVEVIPLLTGEIKVPRSVLLDLDHPAMKDVGDEEVWVPVLAYLVRHTRQGYVLIDTGFDASFAQSGHGNFGGLAKLVTIGRQKPGHDTVSLLRELGVDPAALKMIVLSHMHADHTAGLPALPKEVPVVTGPNATKSHEVLWYAPHDHLEGREAVHALELDESGVLDLFGDGSLLVFATPGHAEGNLSFLVHTKNGATLLTCDASHTREGFEQGIAPGKTVDAEAAKRSLDRLRRYLDEHPETRIKAGHDPDDWDLSRGIQDAL